MELFKSIFNKNFLKVSFIFLLPFFFLIKTSIDFNSYTSKFGPYQEWRWNTSYKEILDRKGGDDLTNYVVIAKSIINNGFFESLKSDSFNIWPPGLPSIHSIIIYFFGYSTHPIPIFFFVSISLWSYIFFKCSLLVEEEINNNKKLLLLLLLMSFVNSDLINTFFIKQAGLLSEGLSTPLFIIALIRIFDLCNCEKNNPSQLITLLLLIGAAFIRVIFDFFITIFFIIYIIYIAYFLIKNNRLKINQNLSKFFLCKKPLLILLLLYEVSTFPYRLAMLHYHDNFALNNANFVWTNNWMPDEYLASFNAGWLIAGGANISCHIDPVTCSEIYNYENSTPNPYQNYDKFRFYKYLTYKNLIMHPFVWVKYKFKIFIKYWFAVPPDVADANSFSFINLPLFFGLIFILAKSMIALGRVKYYYNNPNCIELFMLDFALPMAIIIGFIFPSLLTHLEVRYLYLPKCFIYFLILLSLKK